MTKLFVTMLLATLAACGSSPGHNAAKQPETVAKPRVDRRPKLRNECELVATDARIKLQDNVVTADVYVCKVTVEVFGRSTTASRVEFQYSQGGWGGDAVTIDASIGVWPSDGRVPEFYDPNLNCELQTCSKL